MANITIDTSNLTALINKATLVNALLAKRALGRGLQKIAAQGMTAAKSEIARQYNVKARDVAKRITVKVKATQATIQAKSRSAKSSRIPVIDFMTAAAKNKTKSGISFTISKASGKKQFKHAFIATMPNGYQGVYERIPGTRKLKELKGIDVTQMMTGKRVLPAVTSKINANATKVMTHELQFELSRAGM